MISVNLLLGIIVVLSIPAVSIFYFIAFQMAIRSAIKENHGAKFFNRLHLVFLTIVGIAAVYLLNRGILDNLWLAVVATGITYLLLEVPYQLVKYAAKAMVDEIEAVGEDKRETARLKQAQTLAAILGEKLQVDCELQAFSRNEEFVFLTYILNSKPIATRIKLNQADKAENWKKLGEWIMTNYQRETQDNKA